MFIPRKFIPNLQLYILWLFCKSHRERKFSTSCSAENGAQGLGILVLNYNPSTTLVFLIRIQQSRVLWHKVCSLWLIRQVSVWGLGLPAYWKPRIISTFSTLYLMKALAYKEQTSTSPILKFFSSHNMWLLVKLEKLLVEWGRHIIWEPLQNNGILQHSSFIHHFDYFAHRTFILQMFIVSCASCRC